MPVTPERTTSFHYARAAYKQHDEPWEQMTQTFAWVREQQITEMLRQNEETVHWILERKKRHLERQMSKALEEVVFALEREMDAELWLAHAREQEVMRSQLREKREAEKRRVFQEELRRMHRRRKVEEDRRARAKAVKGAWARYESSWDAIRGGERRLSYADIPWPLVSRPRSGNDITTDGIREFLLSESHSTNQSNKERLKTALRLWHPDRFQQVLRRVEDKDRSRAAEVAGAVARSLNSLMESVQ
jgi:hypothetical protein